MTKKEYTLSELTEAAGVSARTVRYYISEGLLPPPQLAGPHSYYSPAHLHRLLLIGALKNAYLPLREIRRTLDGMSDAEIKGVAQQTVDLYALSASGSNVPPQDDAAAYIARTLNRLPAGSAVREMNPSAPPITFPGLQERAYPDDAGPSTHDVAAIEGSAWRRIELGPDAELLIREDACMRKRDRIEWLVNWARRVFN